MALVTPAGRSRPRRDEDRGEEQSADEGTREHDVVAAHRDMAGNHPVRAKQDHGGQVLEGVSIAHDSGHYRLPTREGPTIRRDSRDSRTRCPVYHYSCAKWQVEVVP